MIFLDSVESTHVYLKEYIKKNNYSKPIAVITSNQTNGIGSRDNSWDGNPGNLFFSFVIDKNLLTSDLPIQSSSIYFSYLLKELLENEGSTVWLKWPNDFYVLDKKIGGTITNLSGDLYYCGIGLNLHSLNELYGSLDIKFDTKILLKNYFELLYSKRRWKKIFSKYKIEFEYSKEYKTTINHKKVSLKNAYLNEDGSISIDKIKVFSLR